MNLKEKVYKVPTNTTSSTGISYKEILKSWISESICKFIICSDKISFVL